MFLVCKPGASTVDQTTVDRTTLDRNNTLLKRHLIEMALD